MVEGKKSADSHGKTAHSLFPSFIPFCYQNGGTNYSHVTLTFSTNIVSTPSSLLSAFFNTSLYLFDLIVYCVQLLHVSVSDKNQHALPCSFPKTAATRCEFHTTAAWWDLFFFFLSPSEWGRGVGVGGGVCARDGEQWPNCWAATRLSPEDFLLNSGPPNSVWHATSWGEETRIIKKQREGDWGEPLMPSRLSQTLVPRWKEKKKSRIRCGFFSFFSFAADRQTLSKRRRRVDVLTRARLLFHLFLCSNAFTS